MNVMTSKCLGTLKRQKTQRENIARMRYRRDLKDYMKIRERKTKKKKLSVKNKMLPFVWTETVICELAKEDSTKLLICSQAVYNLIEGNGENNCRGAVDAYIYRDHPTAHYTRVRSLALFERLLKGVGCYRRDVSYV